MQIFFKIFFLILTLCQLLVQWFRIIQSYFRYVTEICLCWLYFYCLLNQWKLLDCSDKASEMSWGRASSHSNWHKMRTVAINVELSVFHLLWIATAVQRLSISNTFAKQKEKTKSNRELQYYIRIGHIWFKSVLTSVLMSRLCTSNTQEEWSCWGTDLVSLSSLHSSIDVIYFLWQIEYW